MSRIRVLPDAVASRIAAGEVVERPASVVKELVENALDAGARRIDVEMEEGGRRRIVVTDDGSGMDRDDALLAFEQHATSKVDETTDLLRIATRGFRGEAIPAIAAVARVTLVTCPPEGDATRVRVDFGRMRDVATVGAPVGTSVEVRDLFAELPARRKFLRSAATEVAHALRFMEQQALALPAHRFRLTHEGRVLLDAVPAPDENARVRLVFGADFADRALAAAGEAGGVRVRAWLVRSGSGGTRAGQLTLLVNGRPVTDRVLSHAVREASGRLFGHDGAPAGVVLVDLDPSEVDVNVHPAKREVRFARPGAIHDLVRDVLCADVLDRGALAPAIGSETGDRLAAFVAAPRASEAGSRAGEPAPDHLPWAAPGAPAGERESGVAREAAAPASPRPPATDRAPRDASPLGTGRRVLGQHRNTYILAEDEQGLLLVDQHCAHERILYEQFLDGLGQATARQALLQPAIVELPRSQAIVVEEAIADLERLGLEVEPFGDGAFAVRAVPAVVGTADPGEILRELAGSEEPGSRPLERVERLAATMACHASVRAGAPLGHERMRWLVDRLMLARVPTTCPHGRVAMLRLSDADIDHRFQRI